MSGLTVGYVSGLIALGIFLFQLVVPNSVTLLLVHFLGNEQSATSWAVAGRELQSSLWSQILQTETVESFKIKPSLRWTSWLRQAVLVITTVAAVVTPLGLFSYIDRSSETSSVPFSYVRDSSPIQLGTMPPADGAFARVCGYVITHEPCPGHPYSTGAYNTTIPEDRFNLFQSGLADQPPTVSSMFDIQWRQYAQAKMASFESYSEGFFGKYRQLATMLPNDGIKLVEGLVVDYASGGIGFRNHTIPAGTELGAEWEEDLLFVEPETACTDTNLTVHFHLQSGVNSKDEWAIVDNGGFVDLEGEYPEHLYLHTQTDPEMQFRSYKGAFVNNAATMIWMNITGVGEKFRSYVKSHLGAKHPVDDLGYEGLFLTADAIQTTHEFGSYLLHTQDRYPTSKIITDRGVINNLLLTAQLTCQGAGGGDAANITNIGVSCGLIYGSPRPVAGGDPMLQKYDTMWYQPIYSCASTTKASIKTVRFRYNATAESGQTPRLGNLAALSVRDKQYDHPSQKPYWGVENSGDPLFITSPLWGLVTKEAAQNFHDGVDILQSERLYLPGSPDYAGGNKVNRFNHIIHHHTTATTQTYQYVDNENLPGANFYLFALLSMYSGYTGFRDVGGAEPSQILSAGPIVFPLYSGEVSVSLLAEWQKLSSSVSTVPRMMNLIWTDLAANAVQGSRSWLTTKVDPSNLSKGAEANRAEAMVRVYQFQNSIGYNWPFSVPAFVLLALSAIIVAGACYCITLGNARPSRIRFYLNRSSAGRLLTVSSAQEMDLSPKKWITTHGDRVLNLSRVSTDKEDSSSTEVRYS